MSERLKECPFCGGAAQLLPGYNGHTKVWRVICTSCYASSMTNEIPSTPVCYWNQRADYASSRYFQNRDCEDYPCHAKTNAENFNCLFCYCPLYGRADCGGDYTLLSSGIKDCTNCKLPHEDYEYVIARLRE